jgi:hypothetical protein
MSVYMENSDQNDTAAMKDSGCRDAVDCHQHVAAYRRRRRIFKVLPFVYFVVWIGGVNLVESFAERSRHEKVQQLLEHGGIRVTLKAATYIIDAASYQQWAAASGEEEELDKLLLRSARAGADPPSLEMLAFRDDDLPTGAYVVLACMLMLPLGPYVAWRRPPRISLLRPFGARRVSVGLRRFARKNMTAWGHVITISDRDLKSPSWFRRNSVLSPAILYAPLGLLLSPFTRQMIPNLAVAKEEHLTKVHWVLGSTLNLNFFALFSFLDRIRKVRSTDEFWKRTVDTVLDHAAIIVVDVTVLTRGVGWEVERIATRELTQRTVFIAMDRVGEEAVRLLAETWPVNTPRIHLYSHSGRLTDEPQFTNAMAAVLSAEPRPLHAG